MPVPAQPQERDHTYVLGEAYPIEMPGTKDPPLRAQTQDSPTTALKIESRFALITLRRHRTPDSPAARTTWEHKLSMHQKASSSHRRRIHVLWCSMNTNIPNIKSYGHSPLVVRLVVAVYNCGSCVIYYMTLVAQDTDIANGALARQYNIPFSKCFYLSGVSLL